MNFILNNQEKMIAYFLRMALAIGFLSAVADRLGFWGSAGSTNVAWGNFENFEHYVLYLNPYLNSSFVTIVSWVVTLLEILFALFLLFNYFIKETALLSALLLLSFAVSMSFVSGIKVPFDYSVYTASAAAFSLFLLQSKALQD